MDRLTKEFKSYNVLTAAELMLLVNKINDIVNWINLQTTSSGSEGGGDGEGGDGDVDSKINAAVQQLRTLIAEMETRLGKRIDDLVNQEDGHGSTRTDEEWAEWLKKTLKGENGGENIINGVLMEMGVLNENGDPYWDVTVLQHVEEAAGIVTDAASTIEVLKDQIGLLVVRQQDGTDVVKPAAIIAAIKDNNGLLESSIGISADKIVLDGTTFAEEIITKGLTAGKLTATLAEIDNLVVTGTFKTGTTGYIAQMGAYDNSGCFEIYNSQTSVRNVRITGYQNNNDEPFSSGGYIAINSSDYSVANKTGWQLTIGGHGINMVSYINGKQSVFGLSPDAYGARYNSNATVAGDLYFETIEGDTALYRRTIAGNNVDTSNV